MKSKIRRDTIIWVIGLITITSLLIAAVLNNHDITVYTLEGDSSVQLQIKDGEYTLNGHDTFSHFPAYSTGFEAFFSNLGDLQKDITTY